MKFGTSLDVMQQMLVFFISLNRKIRENGEVCFMQGQDSLHACTLVQECRDVVEILSGGRLLCLEIPSIQVDDDSREKDKEPRRRVGIDKSEL